MTNGMKRSEAASHGRCKPSRAARFSLCLLAFAVLLAVLPGCDCGRSDLGPVESPEDDGQAAVKPTADSAREALAEFNRGAGLMEQYTGRPDALDALGRAVELEPDWIAARYNLGLANLHLGGSAEEGEKDPAEGVKERYDVARDLFEQVLAEQPDHVHAHFSLGVLCRHLGDTRSALEHFEVAHRLDPDDPFVAFKYGEALADLDRADEAMKLFERCVELDPGFISGIYRLAGLYMRAGQREKAIPLFDRFNALKATELAGGTFGVELKYGTLGRYYMVLGPDNLPLQPPDGPSSPRIIFSPETTSLEGVASAWPWSGGSTNLPGVAAGDVDADGDLDLCLTVDGGAASLWLNDGQGGFVRGETVADRAVSPCFGDVDNDGDLDLWLGRVGQDLLLTNDGAGNFTPTPLDRPSADPSIAATDRAGIHVEELTSVGPADEDPLQPPEVEPDLETITPCARLADLDSDGDLDLLAFRLAAGSVPTTGDAISAATIVHNNNRDGTFVDIAQRLGLDFPNVPIATVVYDDFDNDRDLDMVVFPAGQAEPIAWVNDRVWTHHRLDARTTGLAVSHVISATSGDPNRDGRRDLLIFTDDGVRLYLNRGRFRFELHEDFANRVGSLGGSGGQFADMDNDGDLDLVIPDANRRDGGRGPVLLVNDWPRDRFLDASLADAALLFAALECEAGASCVVADFTGNGLCDVLLAPTGQAPYLVKNVTQGGHWAEFDLTGTRPGNKEARSNQSAIGARVEIKTGTVVQQFVVGVPSGPVAMPPLRIHAGLGEYPSVQWLRIIWPDAVLQAELELAADRVTTIEEVPRKGTSCPHLFAWDGSRFQFVADFGGVGGLGYLVAPGLYATPDPTELLPLPELQPLDGYYVLQAIEPLEEVVYLDEVKLVAVDHPIDTRVYPNEMAAVNAPPPTAEIFCFAETIDPISAVDHRGVDVTDMLRDVDRRYAGATELDPRFTGYAEEHFVELDFGDRLAELALDARLILFLHGWVDYSYSSTNFAAAQAGLRLEAPSVHVLRDGRWVELFHEVGYPAGLQHMMSLEVTGKILPGDRRIRISSNMAVYWDRIYLARRLGEAPLFYHEAAVAEADLHFRGYPREYSPDGRHPNLYDYTNVDRTACWKLMEGDYTRFGRVDELLDAPDDRFVIMGPGDEVTLRFPADAFGPVPEGYRRSFLLKTDTFCKGMNLMAAHPDSVEPLPFHAMSGYPYGEDEQYPDNAATGEYRRRYNTRRVRTRAGSVGPDSR